MTAPARCNDRARTTAMLLGAALALAGCGTLLNSGGGTLTIQSMSGVQQVVVNNMPVPTVPVVPGPQGPLVVQVDLPRTSHALVVYTNAGPQSVYVAPTIGAGWVVLDIFLTGFIGLIVDAVSNGWSSFDTITVQKQQPAPLPTRAATQAPCAPYAPYAPTAPRRVRVRAVR